MRRISVLYYAIFSLAVATTANAEQIANPIPTALLGPGTYGILVPGYNVAAAVDAAALPLEKGTALQLADSPSPFGSNSNDMFGSIATSNQKIGIGAGVSSLFTNNFKNAQAAAFAGLGFSFQPVSLGVSVRDVDVHSGGPTDVDLSFIYNNPGGVSLGAVAYGVNTGLQLGLGVGYRSGKKYHLEADLLTPPPGGSGTSLGVAGGMNVEFVNVFFDLSYLINGGAYYNNGQYYGGAGQFTYIFGLAVWAGDHVNFLAQYANVTNFGSGMLTLGVTFVF